MHEVLVIRLGGLSLPRKSVVRLTDRPDMTLDVYRVKEQYNQPIKLISQLQTDSQPGGAHYGSLELLWEHGHEHWQSFR